jgi:hypothetical protein
MRQSTEVVPVCVFRSRMRPPPSPFSPFFIDTHVDANNSGRSFPSLFPNVFLVFLRSPVGHYDAKVSWRRTKEEQIKE